MQYINVDSVFLFMQNSLLAFFATAFSSRVYFTITAFLRLLQVSEFIHQAFYTKFT